MFYEIEKLNELLSTNVNQTSVDILIFSSV